MPNPENIKPPKKGEPSRNPNGRPKGAKNRSTLLKKWLSVATTIKNPVTKEVEQITVEDEVVLSLINQARKGNVTAIREILDTTYGKVADKIEITVSPEIEAARGLYESLVESGLQPKQAVKKVIQGAKLNGFELTETDILDADTIG